MPLFTITLSAGNGSFDIDYRTADEESAWRAAARDFPDLTIEGVRAS